MTLPPSIQRPPSIERFQRNPGMRAAMAFRSLLSQGLAGGETIFGLGGAGFVGQHSYAATHETETLQDGYLQDGWMAAAINLLVTTVTPTVQRVYDRDPMDENRREITSGPLVDILTTPHEDLSQDDLQCHDAINIALSGESFWALLDANDQPIQPVGLGADAIIPVPAKIKPVRGDLAVPERDTRTDKIVTWRLASRHSDTGMRDFPAGSVVQFYEFPHHAKPGRGLGRMEQAWGAAAQRYLARRYNDVWMENFGDPGGALTYDGWLTPGAYDRIQNQIEERMNNPAMRGATHLIEGGGKLTPTTAKPRDMAFEILWDKTIEEVAAVWGTPPGLLGLQVDNFATFRGFLRVYVATRLKPYLRMRAGRINRHFVSRLANPTLRTQRVGYDMDEVEDLIDDIAEKAQHVEGLLRAGVTPAEALLAAGISVDPAARPSLSADVHFADRALVPRDLMYLQEAGAALSALQAARVPDADALRLTGLEDMGVIALDEKQAPPPMIPGQGVDDRTGDPVAQGGEDPAPMDDERSAGGMVRVAPVPTAKALESWDAREKRLQGYRSKVRGSLRRMWNVQRAQQLDAIATFAATGDAPDVPEGDVTAAESVLLPSLSARDHGVPDADVATAYRAIRGDLCEDQDCTARVDAFLERRPRYRARMGRDDFIEVVLATKAGISGPNEISRLVIVGQARFLEEMATMLAQDGHLPAYASGARATANAFGVGVIDTTHPSVLDRFARKAIRVVEGTQSDLARRLRRNILSALAEGPAEGTVQERIEAALSDVSAGTTRAFNSHRHRASVIARTETGAADNGGQFDQLQQEYREGRIAGIAWQTSGRGPEPTGPTRLSHWTIEQNGEVRVPGQRFSNGLRYPLDDQATNPSEVVNCECVPRAVFPE